MHRHLIAATCAAVLGSIVAEAPAAVQAAAKEVVIVNRGHHTLVELYSRDTTMRQMMGTTYWGDNLLGKAELAPGVEMHFNAPRDRTACTQDLKGVYSNGHVATGSVNVCTANEVQLRY